jgi:cytochrome c-type biogenesis protein CcmH
MTLFLALAAALTAAALIFLLPPLLRGRTAAPDARTAANAAIYREQLEELGAELQRGALTKEEFERASREIEHRIVAEHGAGKAGGAPEAARHRAPVAAAIAVGLLVPLVAVLGYWQLGSPIALSGSTKDPAHSVSADQMEVLVERLSARMQQTPDDAEGWMLLGRSLNVLGQYERAAQAYAKAAKLTPNDADLLADYADTLAMARGRKLEGEPFEIVQRALQANPRQLKALALAGSAEFERRNYAAAIDYWERVLKVAPPESEFGRLVAESVAEARSLAGGKLARKAAPAVKGDQTGQAAAGAPFLQGVVSIDAALAAKAAPGDAVFILARPASGQRMPLAVQRITVAQLPYRFVLDDSMAMAPGATISSQPQVVVVARVSKAGSAAPAKGDLEGMSGPVKPGASGMRVVISKIVD